MSLIEKPDMTMIKKWGELVYVSDEERKRILELPYGLFKPACKRLKQQIAEMKKQQK